MNNFSSDKIVWFFLVLFLLACVKSRAQSFTKAELNIIKEAKTGKLAFYHSKTDKEFIRLMNLTRLHPDLCFKYLTIKHGVDSVNASIVRKRFAGKGMHLIKPALGLHLSAWIHAVFSGWSGSIGHQNMDLRYHAFLNFAPYYGENCSYGERYALEIFLQLMHSPPHRDNILNNSYRRVGVSKKWHAKYDKNAVTVFSGPSVYSRLFRKKKKQAMGGQIY